jgi:predicted RNA-binding protein with TRAM domain
MPAYYDFFRKLKFLPNNVSIEADSVTDTAQIEAGSNIAFTVTDTSDGGSPIATIDKVTINGPVYDVYVPVTGASPGDEATIRLERAALGTGLAVTTDIDFIADPTSPILISRTGTNSITIGSSSPTLPFSQEQIEDFAASLLQNGTHTEITVNYDDLGAWPNSQNQDATSGSGINALFDISIVNNQYYAVVTAPGSGYAIGNTVTIFGTNFAGGTSPLNDVVITVSSIDGSGGIIAYSSITGTPPPGANIDLAVTSTLENITGRGASSTNAITISNATGSSNTSTGALKLTAGGLAVFENANIGGYVKATTLQSTQTTGTAPLTVASTTMVTNLQAETASKWHTARTVTFTGDVTGTFSIDGSADVPNIALTIGANTVALGTDTTGNYVAVGAVSGNGLSGSTNTEGATFTVTSNAVSTNTGSTIVFRDTNGDFSAGSITASLNGNALTASSLQTARNINGVSFSGGANIVVEPYVESDEATNATRYITFVDSTTDSYQRLNEDSGLTYNPSTGTITATTFSGSLSGGTVSATTITASDTVTFNASAIEEVSVQAAAAGGTVTLDAKTNSVFYYTSNATGNWTLNVRGDGATTMDTFLAVGKSATLVFMATQGATAYYPTTFQVDGVGVTPRWLGGSAPTGGNASSIDSYSFTIIKTAANTYTILASQARFA